MQIGLPQYDCPFPLQCTYTRRIHVRHTILQVLAARGRIHPHSIVIILQKHRNAEQLSRGIPRGEISIEGVRNSECRGIQGDDGVDGWVEGLDTRDKGRDDLATAGEVTEERVVHGLDSGLAGIEGGVDKLWRQKGKDRYQEK